MIEIGKTQFDEIIQTLLEEAKKKRLPAVLMEEEKIREDNRAIAERLEQAAKIVEEIRGSCKSLVAFNEEGRNDK